MLRPATSNGGAASITQAHSGPYGSAGHARSRRRRARRICSPPFAVCDSPSRSTITAPARTMTLQRRRFRLAADPHHESGPDVARGSRDGVHLERARCLVRRADGAPRRRPDRYPRRSRRRGGRCGSTTPAAPRCRCRCGSRRRFRAAAQPRADSSPTGVTLPEPVRTTAPLGTASPIASDRSTPPTSTRSDPDPAATVATRGGAAAAVGEPLSTVVRHARKPKTSAPTAAASASTTAARERSATQGGSGALLPRRAARQCAIASRSSRAIGGRGPAFSISRPIASSSRGVAGSGLVSRSFTA